MLELRARLSGAEELRPVQAADAREMHAVVDANRDHLRPWMPWADQERDATEAFIQNAVADAAAERALHLAIVTDGRIAGCCGFNVLDHNNRATMLGYWLAASAQGNGLMTRAVATMLDHAFSGWGLHRVELRAAPANTRSRAVAERLGFALEGTLREAELVGGRHRDLFVYSMLAREWPGNRPR